MKKKIIKTLISLLGLVLMLNQNTLSQITTIEAPDTNILQSIEKRLLKIETRKDLLPDVTLRECRSDFLEAIITSFKSVELKGSTLSEISISDSRFDTQGAYQSFLDSFLHDIRRMRFTSIHLKGNNQEVTYQLKY